MRRRFLQLLRVWIPSWRFFETLVEQPVLFYRIVPDVGNGVSGEGAWQPALHRPARSIFSAVLNAEGNLHLACYGLIDQFEEDLRDLPPEQAGTFPQSPSYRLVQNLVSFVLRERHRLGAGTRYQFKVCAGAGGHAEPHDILVSPVHTV